MAKYKQLDSHFPSFLRLWDMVERIVTFNVKTFSKITIKHRFHIEVVKQIQAVPSAADPQAQD
jgi:hypothetical protein